MSCAVAAELAEMRNKIRLLQADTAGTPLRLPPGPPLEANSNAFEPGTVLEQDQYQDQPPLPPRRKAR